MPWADGIGNPEGYSSSVALWKAFHNKLPDSNSNKILTDLRGIMLQSQLYGRTQDLSKGIPDSEIQYDTGFAAIIKAVYKRDALSVVSEVYQNFIALLNTKRGHNESFKNFKSQFDAHVSRFNASSESAKWPNALTAFMLLVNASVDSSQRVSVLAAASPADSSVNFTATTDQFLDAFSYSSVASVLRQCEHVKDSNNHASSSTFTALTATNAQNGNNQTHTRTGRGRRTLSPEQLADFKSRSTCHQCHRRGLWHSNHNPDDSLKPGVKSEPVQTNTSSRRTPATSTPDKKTVTFHMAKFPSNSDIQENPVGPLLEDGAPYSGMGTDEFILLQPMLVLDWDGTLFPIPKQISA